MKHVVSQGAHMGGSLTTMRDLCVPAALTSLYKVECFDRQGILRWTETARNLVVDEGLDDILDKYFKGSSYTAAWYVGLIDDATFTAIAAGDTASGIKDTAPVGTNDWLELEDYTESVRQTLTLGTVASQSVDNAASKAAFSINASVTVKGAFVVTSNVKNGTAGVLYGAAAFAASRVAESGDTLNVTVTLTSASV